MESSKGLNLERMIKFHEILKGISLGECYNRELLDELLPKACRKFPKAHVRQCFVRMVFC